MQSSGWAGFDKSRAFPNAMPDYGVLTAEDAVTAEDDVKERIRLELARLQSLLEKNYQAVSVLAPSSVPRASKPDFSIYTGAGGANLE